MAKIIILKGDITTLEVDALVNPANTSLLAGSGLCGLIHKLAGKELEQECRVIGSCPKGQAVTTNGYSLKAKRVIHAIGPHYILDNDKSSELLESCYYNILKLANRHKLKSVAIPAISTGVYQYPIREATDIAIRTIRDFLNNESNHLEKIILVITTDERKRIYDEFFERYFLNTIP